MVQWVSKPAVYRILYPDSDGEPMADNTLQFRWIQVIYNGIAALFRDRQDVFVAGNHLWYAVEGEPEQRQGPDVMVVFGRPRGERGSYMQWEEEGIAPQVVFEVLSPGNTGPELARKFSFYEDHGVEEYYIYDPDHNRLEVYQRQGSVLRRIRQSDGWVSPRLGIRFDLSGPVLAIYGPDGRRFMTYEQLVALLEAEEGRAKQALQQAEQSSRQAEQAAQRVEQAARQVEQATQKAEQAAQKAEQATRQAEQATQQAARLAAKLRELGIDPDTIT